jgi:type IV secretory pathway VirB10-like protein
MARRKKNDDDQSTDNPEINDDTFGLPEVEYEPLKREDETVQNETTSEPEAAPQPEQSAAYEREEPRQEYVAYDDDEESSPWPKILGILAILALAGGAYWFFGVYQPKQKEKAKQEQLAREEAERKAEAQRLADESRRAAEQRRADSLANIQTPKEGSIETLSERTRRYYVVIASAIDGDLIMDHAKTLSSKGVSTKIIPPFGKAKFYRLAVAEGDTYNDTQATADGLKGEYGGAVWVIKY